jgi:hypothetical protein
MWGTSRLITEVMGRGIFEMESNVLSISKYFCQINNFININ